MLQLKLSLKAKYTKIISTPAKGKEIIVGSFLNEEDKSILKDEISRIIQKLNAMGFAS